MKFYPNQDFLDGYDRYEKDEEYDLDDHEKVQYFINNGWAHPEGYDPSLTLEVHDAGSAQE